MLPLQVQIQRESNGAPGGAPPAPPPSPPPPAATQPPAGGGGSAPVDWEARATKAEAELATTRREAAGYRTGNKGQLAEAAKAFAALAGVTLADDKTPPDMAALAAKLDERIQKQDAEMRTLKIDNALGEIFVKHGVKAKLARAVLESEGVLKALDPGDAEFSKTLSAAVKKLSEDYPELKVQATAPPPPTRSTIERPAGNGTPPQLTQAEIAAMSPEAVVKARKAGQLDQLLGRQT